MGVSPSEGKAPIMGDRGPGQLSSGGNVGCGSGVAGAGRGGKHRQGCLPRCPSPCTESGRPLWGPSAVHRPAGASVASVLEAPPWRRPRSCLPARPAQPPGLPALPLGVNPRPCASVCRGPVSVRHVLSTCPGSCGRPASPMARPRAGSWLFTSGLNYPFKVDGSSVGWRISLGGGCPPGQRPSGDTSRAQSCTGCLDLARRERALPRSPVWTPKG